jgi:S1/P1 Nuclease
MAKIRLVALFAILVFSPHPASAWNIPAHMLSGAIAYQILRQESPGTIEKVKAVLEKHPWYANQWQARLQDVFVADHGVVLFMRAARWPDELRSADRQHHRGPWHYINWPFKPDGQPAMGNEICVRVTRVGQPMDLHRFWDGVITSSSNLTRLRNEATVLRNRQEFQRSQLSELGNPDFESWAKESFEIATKIAYQNGGRIGIPKAGTKDCTMVAAVPLLPAGYTVSASRIADRRIILAAHRLADLLKRVFEN